MKPRITIDMERRLATTIDVHRFIQDINAGKFDRIVEALAGDDIEAQEEAYMELDRLVSTYTANNNKYPQRQQQTVLALTAKELLGKNLPDEYDWHGAFPVCDENGLIEDIIDADGYSHITGLAWDLTEYRWNGEAYFPAYFPVDLGALKRTPADRLWEEHVGDQSPVEFWRLAVAEDPDVTPEGACIEYMEFRMRVYPGCITPNESLFIAHKLAEYIRGTLS